MRRVLVGFGLVALILVACVSALVLYSPATAESSAPVEPTELEDSYAVSETLFTDGTEFSSRDVSYDAETGERRTVIAFEDATYDTYTTSDGETYTKHALSDHEYFLDVVDGGADTIVEADEHALTVITNETDGSETTAHAGVTFPDRLMGGTLERTDYERTDRYSIDGADGTVYEPRTGWFDWDSGSADTTLYVSDAGGELHVDSSGAIRSANVSYEATHAETWAEYLLERDESFTTTYEYDLEEPPDAMTPEWFDAVEP